MDLVVLYTAKYLVFVIVLLAGVYWLTLPKKQKIQMLIFAVILAIVAFLLTRIGGMLYYDPRPFVSHSVTPIYPHPDNNGFPSDHTALAFVVASSVFYMSKKIGAIFLVLALMVGVSRVIGNIHSPIDIVGSIVFVVIAYVLSKYATKYILMKLEPKSIS